MVRSESNLLAYVEKILGVRLRLEPFTGRLPLIQEARYSVRRAWLFDRELMLCFPREGFQASPGDLAAGAQALQESLRAVPVYVIPSLTSWDRDRLIRRGIAFIVPGSQLYLPQFLVDLREKFQHKAAAREWLPWLAQVIVITHLIKESLEGETVRGLSRRLGHPASSLSRAIQSLEACGLARSIGGKSRPLSFAANTRELWILSRPRLRSPVTGRYYSDSTHTFDSWPVSGEEALNLLTDVSARDERCRAVFNPILRAERASHPDDFSQMPLDRGALVLESWAYDPQPLASRGSVDPCSLSLAYADEADERIQKGLERAVQGSLRP